MKIFIEFDVDSGRYVLMCDCGRMSPTPAGARLFRGGRFPLINFTHPTMEEAEDAMKKLKAYLDALPPRKPSKKQQREFVA